VKILVRFLKAAKISNLSLIQIFVGILQLEDSAEK